MNLKRFLQRSQEDGELVQELESHLQHEIDDNLARGMSAEEARRLAHVKLGNPLVIRDKVWESNRISWLGDLWRDLRYAVRTLAKTPGFTCVVVLVMALGVGANASIFSFLDSVLLRSLPVSDPASLVVVNWHAKPNQQDSVMQEMSGTTDEDNNLGMVSGILPYPAFELFRRESNVFSDIFGYCRSKEVRTLNVLIKGQAEVAAGELVTGAYFRGLSIVPTAGRLIIPDDDRAGAPAVAVVSYGFSEKYLGGHANAVGQSVQINNLPFTVVGVAPPEFFGVDPSTAPEVYLPMHTNVLFGTQIPFGFGPADYLNANYYWLEIMARLRPGVSLEQAQAKLAPQFQQWVATTAHNDAQRANLPVLYLREGASGIDTLRRRFSKPLYLLMTLVILILAIACSNVANLLLSRTASRKREIALRLSQGASRFRVIRQLLTESIVLSSVGGSIGVLLAVLGIRVLSALLVGGPDDIGVHAELNWHVLLVAAFLSVFTGMLFGLAPALQSTHLDLVSSLKETQTGQTRPRHGFGRISATHFLVIGQIAISLLILVAAGLFVRTLTNLQSVNLGFNRENVLLFRLNARQAGHHDAEISELYARLRNRFAAIPGVRQVSLADSSLITAGDGLPITVLGKPPRDDTRFIPVGPEFLTTMQIPLVAGRDFSLADRPGSPAVAVINEEFARINFPNEDPLGQHLFLWKAESDEEIAKASWNDKKNVARDMEIVGIARNAN